MWYFQVEQAREAIRFDFQSEVDLDLPVCSSPGNPSNVCSLHLLTLLSRPLIVCVSFFSSAASANLKYGAPRDAVPPFLSFVGYLQSPSNNINNNP